MAARAQSRVSVAVLAVRVPAQYYNSCLAAGDTIIIDGDQPHTTINTTIILTRGKLGGKTKNIILLEHQAFNSPVKECHALCMSNVKLLLSLSFNWLVIYCMKMKVSTLVSN